MATTKLFLFSMLCLMIASVRSESGRGIDAKEGKLKYQAILYSLISGNPSCGGAIINILSSGYCMEHYVSRPDKIVAYLGTLNIYKKNQESQIAEIEIPREFVISEKHHDIALI